MIYEYTGALKGYLKSYLPSCKELILNMILDKHSSDIRSSASLAVKPLMEAYIHNMKCIGSIPAAEVIETWKEVCTGLLTAINGEINVECKSCAVEALRDHLCVLYDTGIEDVYGFKSNYLLSLQHTVFVEPIVHVCIQTVTEAYQQLLNVESSNVNNEGLDRDAGITN